MPGRCSEPSLDEVMTDPIVRILMSRDSVAERDLARLIEGVRRRLGRDATRAPIHR